jgi:tetratricopeptide (TPR) repeat protein
VRGSKEKSIFATYRVREGKQLVNAGRGREGRIRFKDALKIDPGQVSAYIGLADSYVQENRQKDALDQLRKMVLAVPEKAHLAFDWVERILFDAGSFDDVENVYQAVIGRNPDLADAYIALASLYERRGEIYKAIEMAKQGLAKDANFIKAHVTLARLYHAVEKDDAAAKHALDAIDLLAGAKPILRCDKCGVVSDTAGWICPECGSTNTMA